tara:strand:+ start:314 stop:514 length:201 start_codon:yes stop_codon:yes gene_type:complete
MKTEYKKDIITYLESQKNWLAKEHDTALEALQLADTQHETALLMVYHNSLLNDIIARIQRGEIKKD